MFHALASERFDVWAYDVRYSDYVPKEKTIIGNILDEKKVDDALKNTAIVYNFAAMADIEECIERPIEAVKQNILGHTILAYYSSQNKVERFIFASSIYAKSATGGFYKSSKAACESLLKDFKKYYDLSYTILQYGALYGPGATENNAIYRYLKQALTDRKIKYHGDGSEVREYIHVYDAAQLSIAILDEAYANESVILTGDKTMKITELFDMIKEMLGEDIDIEYSSADLGHILHSHYKRTPYSFCPQVAKKVVAKNLVDLGEGLWQCVNELYNTLEE